MVNIINYHSNYFTNETSLPYYLPIAGGRIIGFIPFPRVLALCEMQTVWSRIELVSLCPFPLTTTIAPRHIQYRGALRLTVKILNEAICVYRANAFGKVINPPIPSHLWVGNREEWVLRQPVLEKDN